MTRNLTITATPVPSGTVLTLVGDLHLHTVPRLRDALDRTDLADGQQLIIDLHRLDFCDSSGIAALVAAYRHSTNAGASFALAAPNERLTRLFALVGLDRLLPLYPTAAAAQDAWRPPSP